MLSCLSRVRLFATSWAHQGPLSMGFSRQGYWSGLSCPPPGDLPEPGIEPASPMSPALASKFFLFVCFTKSATWEDYIICNQSKFTLLVHFLHNTL